MKTKYWLLGLLGLLILCLGLSFFLLDSGGKSCRIEIYSRGELRYTLSLLEDRTVTVETDTGTNTVTIRDGAVAVTQASCPDHYCMHRGFCTGGADIVCLPNRLVIRFVGEQEIDGAVG